MKCLDCEAPLKGHGQPVRCAPCENTRRTRQAQEQAALPLLDLLTPATIERFWSYVRKTNGCWLWIGTIHHSGYGQFGLGSKTTGAHRIAFMITYGRKPHNYVCHTCDNKPCVRPDHLFDGTQADNMRDRDAKHRTAFGPANGQTKFSYEVIENVRIQHSQGASERKIAANLKVSRRHVRHVLANETRLKG